MCILKRITAVLLTMMMVISSMTIMSFAEVSPIDMTQDKTIMDLIYLNGGIEHVRKDSTVYYPITISSETRIADLREGTDTTYHNYGELVSRKTGIADGKTVITSHVVYDADTLKYEGVLPSEELYLKGGSVSTTSHGAETSAEILNHLSFTNARCFDIEVTVQNFADIEENMVLFNFKFTVLQENFFYMEEGNGKYYPNTVLSWKNNLSFDVFGSDGATENLNNLLSSEDLIFEIDSADSSVLTEKYKDYTPYDTSTLNSGMIFFGGQNHYRKDNTVYYPYKNNFDFSNIRSRYGNVKIRFNLMLEYDADILEFDSLLSEKALSELGTVITIIKQSIGRTPSNFENCGYVSFTFEMNSSDVLADKNLMFTPKFNVLKEAFVNNFGMPKMVQCVTGTVYVINDGNPVPEAVAFSLEGDEATIGEGFTYDDLLKEFADYTPSDLKPSSIDSVDYEQSFSSENDYTFKVNGQAVKIAFLFRNNSTLTVARSGAKIKSFDKDGNEVPQGSKNIDYELWTVHRSLKVNEEIKVRAKFSTGWEDEFKSFTVYLKYQELPFVESVTYTPSFSAENDYVLKVNCIADKVQFINPNGTTATYTKSSAKSVVSFDKNGNEVPVNSKDTAYEIWTVHRTMKTDCEMFVHVKTGGKWENETKAFIVELKKKDVSSIESVTWKGDAVSRNDYYIKVNGRPDKIAFVNPDGTTATYSRDKAKIKCYDANGNEVPSDSKNISYEIWTINRSMRMNVEMRAVAKFGKTTETEMFTFTVK